MLVYPSGIDLSSSTLSRLLSARRLERGTRWRRPSADRQALPVLAHPRCGHTHAQLAAGFGVGTATVHRYVAEAVEVPAAVAPDPATAARTAAHTAFVILDGTLPPIDRIAADRPFHSGKHKKHGMNAQVIADPFGRLPWALPALPGAVHDVKAARTHGVIGAPAEAGVRCWADKTSHLAKSQAGPDGRIVDAVALRVASQATRGGLDWFLHEPMSFLARVAAMSLPSEVHRTTSTFLAAIDDASPGLVEGLYLHGSLGFGEFYPDRSDIDFVAVLTRRPDADALDALAAAHQVVRERCPRPFFDGFHALRQDLTQPPEMCPDLPCTQAGTFKKAGRFGDVNPVTWHELARHGVAVRGPALTDAEVWTDDVALRAYSHGNLASYWSEIAQALAQSPEEASTTEAAEWCVLGVSRLHHLLATGNLTSKSGAGRYALSAFEPRWQPIVTEALRIREASDTPSSYDGAPDRLGRDTTDFTAMVVDAGLALDPSLAI